MFKHSFTHESFSDIQWLRLLEIFTWLMRVCPDFHDAPTSRYPTVSLRGYLVAQNKTLVKETGRYGFSQPKLIDHENAAPSMWEGNPAIVFDGDGQFGDMPFVLGPTNTQGWKSVDTRGKPYDLLVCTMLILANHTAPGAIRIKSESPVENWEPALMLARQYDDTVEMPEGILPRSALYVDALSILPPAHMDFRS